MQRAQKCHDLEAVRVTKGWDRLSIEEKEELRFSQPLRDRIYITYHVSIRKQVPDFNSTTTILISHSQTWANHVSLSRKGLWPMFLQIPRSTKTPQQTKRFMTYHHPTQKRAQDLVFPMTGCFQWDTAIHSKFPAQGNVDPPKWSFERLQDNRHSASSQKKVLPKRNRVPNLENSASSIQWWKGPISESETLHNKDMTHNKTFATYTALNYENIKLSLSRGEYEHIARRSKGTLQQVHGLPLRTNTRRISITTSTFCWVTIEFSKDIRNTTSPQNASIRPLREETAAHIVIDSETGPLPCKLGPFSARLGQISIADTSTQPEIRFRFVQSPAPPKKIRKGADIAVHNFPNVS